MSTEENQDQEPVEEESKEDEEPKPISIVNSPNMDIGKTISQIFLGPSQALDPPKSEEYAEKVKNINPSAYSSLRVAKHQTLVARKCPQGYLGNCLYCSYFPCNFIKGICLEEILRDVNK